MNKIIDRASEYLVAQRVIHPKDTAIYRYGMEMMFLTIAEVASILLIAAFVGNFFETFLYFLAFIPLRLFAGGYHATTRLRCYLLSLAVYGVFSFCLVLVPVRWLGKMSLGAALLSFISIYIWAPVIHKNKSVSAQDISSYRKISRFIALSETAIIILGCLFYQSIGIFAFALGFLSEAYAILVTKR